MTKLIISFVGIQQILPTSHYHCDSDEVSAAKRLKLSSVSTVEDISDGSKVCIL